jgi:hypothetical protein
MKSNLCKIDLYMVVCSLKGQFSCSSKNYWNLGKLIKYTLNLMHKYFSKSFLFVRNTFKTWRGDFFNVAYFDEKYSKA